MIFDRWVSSATAHTSAARRSSSIARRPAHRLRDPAPRGPPAGDGLQQGVVRSLGRDPGILTQQVLVLPEQRVRRVEHGSRQPSGQVLGARRHPGGGGEVPVAGGAPHDGVHRERRSRIRDAPEPAGLAVVERCQRHVQRGPPCPRSPAHGPGSAQPRVLRPSRRARAKQNAATSSRSQCRRNRRSSPTAQNRRRGPAPHVPGASRRLGGRWRRNAATGRYWPRPAPRRHRDPARRKAA